MTYERARLSLERSGGFAGLSTTYTVDTGQLDPKRREDYLALLTVLDLAQLAEPTKSKPTHADQFQYDLRLDLDGSHQQLSFGDASQTPELKTLTQMITSDSHRE